MKSNVENVIVAAFRCAASGDKALTMLYFIDLLGTFAFGLTGGIVAIRKNMDLFGVFVLSLVTAIGGGTTRDIILGSEHLFILSNPVYITIIIASTLCAFLFYRVLLRINSVILILDAFGLGAFVCIGVSKALASGIPPFGSVIMGLITGVAGGMMRDILAKEIPMVLIRDFYAMACVIGGIIYVSLYQAGLPEGVITIISASVIFILRLLAIRYRWNFIRKNDVGSI